MHNTHKRWGLENDHIFEALGRYFASEGEFAVRRDYDNSPGSEFEPVFLPYLRSLDPAGRRRLVRLLAETAVGRVPGAEWRPFHALDVLYRLSRPWPEDHRLLVRDEAKDVLLREFSDEAKLDLWASWEEGYGTVDRVHGPCYALSLYAVLLAVASDEDLAAPLNRLLLGARDTQFRKTLGRGARLQEGARLCSERQLTKEQSFRRYLEVWREMSREAKEKRERGILG